MAIVETQRPALEEVRPENLDGFWPESKMFYVSRLSFWLEEEGRRVLIFFAGIHAGIGPYARHQGEWVAGFVRSGPGTWANPSVLAECRYGVLLEEAPIEQGSPMCTVTLLRPASIVLDSESCETHIVFVLTDRRSKYVALV